jgi:RNase P subunit RPR2
MKPHEKVICDGCARPLIPRPDENMIRLYYACADMTCKRYGKHQRVALAPHHGS